MSQDLARTRAFFGVRAAGWESRFPDDGPAYAAAVAAMGLRPGATVLDAGCGTGRALPALRAAVGLAGRVLGVDATPEMLAEAAGRGRRSSGALLLADATVLPVRSGALDAVFAAGLVSHLPDPASGLRELARAVRPGGVLALFHPIGRAALAARQGRRIADDDLRAQPRLRPLLAAAGWRLASYVDEDDRFLALALRETGVPVGDKSGQP
ncbi:class I SAM-dependent methyltransferase [Streptomyces montanisoli]|uniref:Methyltransferase domain-containing protein n=1 Tax=Streptomyces montanisoli TaxID=2798581 RepID=A0A940MCC3_9ACTN|nr:methyltransferase domain-containing protein [Streptomyces montanisoli]MBP0458308.1 methyltransferase domain-containing protein [Streptomyces montanisoli]